MRNLTPSEAARILLSKTADLEQKEKTHDLVQKRSLFRPHDIQIPIGAVFTVTLDFGPRERRTS